MQKIVSGKVIATSVKSARDRLGVDVARRTDEIVRMSFGAHFFRNAFNNLRVLRPRRISGLLGELRRQDPLHVFKSGRRQHRLHRVYRAGKKLGRLPIQLVDFLERLGCEFRGCEVEQGIGA